ncbi:hypothetical protein KW799_02605, partial [Candidatus Parcubacteria bacterium]|nr:hypothetical protein [Candidatus Parcubacteria bacterium]
QIAGDMASLLNAGAQPDAVFADIDKLRKVDVATSLSPFVAVYDEAGKVLASSGALGGKALSLPQGVFAYADKVDEDRVTLEPEKGVRIASVIRKFDQTAYGKGKGYVVSGKSLREVEDRIGKIGFLAALGWMISIIAFAIKAALKARGESSRESR